MSATWRNLVFCVADALFAILLANAIRQDKCARFKNWDGGV